MARDLEKQYRRNKLLMAFFIIGIMLLSSFAFVINYYSTSNDGTATKVDYNGYKFDIDQNGIYQTNYNGQVVQLYNNPKNIESINLNNIIFNTNKVYLAYNFSENDQSILLDINRVKYAFALKGIISNPSCIEAKDCPDLPVTDCNLDFDIIYF